MQTDQTSSHARTCVPARPASAPAPKPEPEPEPDATAQSSGLMIGDDGRPRPVWAAAHPMLREYYDEEWGMPVTDETGLYERLTLEGFQSGLSWRTVLAKRPRFRQVFAGFDPDSVAAFGAAERGALLQDAGIIRNRLKIDAALANAGAVVAIRDERFAPLHPDSPGAGPSWDGAGDRPTRGLAGLIWAHQPAQTPRPRTLHEVPSASEESRALARALKRHGFRFVGPTTCFALMEAVGVVDTHLLGSWRRGASGVWG